MQRNRPSRGFGIGASRRFAELTQNKVGIGCINHARPINVAFFTILVKGRILVIQAGVLLQRLNVIVRNLPIAGNVARHLLQRARYFENLNFVTGNVVVDAGTFRNVEADNRTMGALS